MQKLIDAELDRMMDVIERPTSAWTNPIVIVTKSNGKVRICLDSRKLNAVSKKMSKTIINTILGEANAERNYIATDKELLANTDTNKKFLPYVQGVKFTVRSLRIAVSPKSKKCYG